MRVLRLRLGWWLWVLAVGLGWASSARAEAVTGVVFDDRNANGVRDAGEPGVAEVRVSDGRQIVRTDGEGRYRLADTRESDGGVVFVIKPRGWRPPVDDRQLPQFYRRVPAVAGETGGRDFPLLRQDEADTFRALIFADTQTYDERDVELLRRTLAEPLAGSGGRFAFGITLGDVVNDRLDLFPAINAVMARIGVPWYAVSGNHDLNFDSPDDRGSVAGFEAVYGPSTYAYQVGPVLFVSLNNVRYLGGQRYIAGLTETQFTFLENLLRDAPVDQRVVLMTHIPWFYPNPANPQTFRLADRARLFALLQSRPNTTFLSGHTHYQRHVFYGAEDGWQGATPLHDYNVAAACGGFWGGPANAEGIPVSTMWDGTPHGYAILEFAGTAVTAMDYRPAQHPAEYQIGLHAPQAVRRGLGYVSYYANVFNGHDGWTVESRVDGRAWAPMRRVLEWDPAYALAFLAQETTATPAPGRRLPDPTVCYHLWRAYLPADLAPGEHTIEVRTKDPFGRAYAASRSTMIVE